MGHFLGKIKWNLKLKCLLLFVCFFTCTNIAFVQNLEFNQEFEEQIVATYWMDNGALSIIVTLF